MDKELNNSIKNLVSGLTGSSKEEIEKTIKNFPWQLVTSKDIINTITSLVVSNLHEADLQDILPVVRKFLISEYEEMKSNPEIKTNRYELVEDCFLKFFETKVERNIESKIENINKAGVQETIKTLEQRELIRLESNLEFHQAKYLESSVYERELGNLKVQKSRGQISDAEYIKKKTDLEERLSACELKAQITELEGSQKICDYDRQVAYNHGDIERAQQWQGYIQNTEAEKFPLQEDLFHIQQKIDIRTNNQRRDEGKISKEKWLEIHKKITERMSPLQLQQMQAQMMNNPYEQGQSQGKSR